MVVVVVVVVVVEKKRRRDGLTVFDVDEIWVRWLG